MTDEDGILRDELYEDRDLYPGYYNHPWNSQQDPYTNPPATFLIRLESENLTAADKAVFVNRLRIVAFNKALTDPEAYIRVLFSLAPNQHKSHGISQTLQRIVEAIKVIEPARRVDGFNLLTDKMLSKNVSLYFKNEKATLLVAIRKLYFIPAHRATMTIAILEAFLPPPNPVITPVNTTLQAATGVRVDIAAPANSIPTDNHQMK